MMATDTTLLQVTSTRNTPDGGAGIPSGTTLHSPGLMPNVVITFVSPVVQIAIRAGKTYFNSMIGLMPVAMAATGGGVEWHTFVMALGHAANYAIGPAVMSVITNAGILLAKWDQKFPTLQA